jgi:hypothetical protein
VLETLLGPCHCNTLSLVLHPSRFYLVIELKKEENVLRPRVAYTLVSRFPLGLMVEALAFPTLHHQIPLVFSPAIIILFLQLLLLLVDSICPMNALV